MVNQSFKWKKKALRNRGKERGLSNEELMQKKLSPNFTSNRDKRTTGLGKVCSKKSAIVCAILNGTSQPSSEITIKKTILRKS